jgi:voltage-gated sodium channel
MAPESGRRMPGPRPFALARLLDAAGPARHMCIRFNTARTPVTTLKDLIESRRFELAITMLILLNAITLGLETSPTIMAAYGGLLLIIDRAILAVFVLELTARVVVYRGSFFRDPWRIFDLVVVGIALLPATGSLSVLRALRILRVLRLISIVPSLKRVVTGFISALPGMGSIVLLLGLVFYVFAVMATKLYGAQFPELFGDIGESLFTLFQVMTLEGWSDGVVRPVMEIYPLAWLFFIPFIVATSFTVLNLFIGVIVSAMEEEHEAEATAERKALQDDQVNMLAEIRALREEVRELARQRA